eukprot:gene9992-11665_t
MKRKLLMLFLSTFLLYATAMAQQMTITGKVSSAEDRLGIPGASVKVKGASTVVQTNSDGMYSINIQKGDVLVFSYIGFESQERTPTAASTVNVSLKTDSRSLDEVVVTAFGVKKDKRTLTYAIQSVKGDDLRQANQSNIINGLQGQIAGAQITSSGGSPGLPSEIILRGVSSLTGDNQPLMIVDGIRVSNASTDGTVNRLADFNPEDIENISVLKGGAAAAIYGIDAASGAIIITTKKGASGKMNVVASAKSFLETVGRLPKRQTMYTTGLGGTYDNSTTASWGRKFRVDEQVYDNPKRFFDTGLTNDFNFNINGGTETYNYYMSGNYRDGSSIIPNTNADKLGILLKGTAKLAPKLELSASVNYIDNKIKEGLVGSNSGGWANSVYRYPSQYDIRNYQFDNGDPNYVYYQDNGGTETGILSPLWNVNKNPRTTRTRRTVLNGVLDYKPYSWLSVSYRMGQDYYNQTYDNITVPRTPGSWDGRLYQTRGNYVNTTSYLNTTFNKEVIKDLNVYALVGATSEYYEAKTNSITGEKFQNPAIHSVNVIEAANLKTTESNPRRQRYALYGDFRLEYKRMLNLSFTGRQDWTSTLPTNARSFFFPSVGASFVFSELMDAKDWSGKVRTIYAKIGKDAPIYRTNNNLTQYLGIGGGFVNDPTGGNPNLKPEVTTNNEYGMELHFFKNRLNIDATYYISQSKDQIISARVPLTTGYVIQTFNAGTIKNKGLELSINGTLMKQKNFQWDMTINAWKNTSKMLELPDQVRVFPYTFGQPYTAAIAASVLDMPVLGIVGTDYQRNSDGYMVIGADGYPLINSTEKQQYIGNREPKFNFGWLNKFQYKDFSLSFLWDIRIGGDVYNATRLGMMSAGIAKEAGDWRDKEFVFNGVVKQPDGSYTKNTKTVILDYNYFTTNYASVGTNFIEKVNWARMRYMTLGYTLPKSFTNRLKVNRIQLEFSAQNPFLFTNYSGGDPEVNSAGPNAGGAEGGSTMGVDFGAIPLSRTYSFGLTVSF